MTRRCYSCFFFSCRPFYCKFCIFVHVKSCLKVQQYDMGTNVHTCTHRGGAHESWSAEPWLQKEREEGGSRAACRRQKEADKVATRGRRDHSHRVLSTHTYSSSSEYSTSAQQSPAELLQQKLSYPLCLNGSVGRIANPPFHCLPSSSSIFHHFIGPIASASISCSISSHLLLSA